ncbi:ligase-associated DNA damage response endonuclease PdeM [Roseobacter litoralis]|uniref:ligase-associated DNA damage response endonuclease PdeM n=1 Tax=Roseobacter litoralis TaxID=42443 RepID=UPI00249417B2|nr:ligase-associated DNA damage response endonuclease PdeM [Roseobacter litoralis]
MNFYDFSFCGITLRAMPSGALFWPDENLLCVSDLHLGKSERVARRSGQTLPPYETRDTLARLGDDLAKTGARIVICLGDSFDDVTAAENLTEEDRHWLMRLQAGRHWIWIEGNHDPGPVEFGGQHVHQLVHKGLTFRHIADPGQHAEISGHYHPKVQLQTRGRMISRPAFLVDDRRLVMPAYGTYTGGLRTNHQALDQLMGPHALAILTGPVPTCVPMPR